MSRVSGYVLAGVVAVAGIALMVVAGVSATSGSGSAGTTGASSTCDRQLFGHLSSITKHGDGYLLKFDPALFTSGITANTAAAEDGVVAKGEPVPNDNYVVDESDRLYVYALPADARVTILTNDGTGIVPTPSSPEELRRILAGEKPVDLFEGLDTGFWMTYGVDTVCTLDQQYHP